MATVWIKPRRIDTGKSIAKTISDCTDYIKNPEKTVDRIVGVSTDETAVRAISDIIYADTSYAMNPDKTYTPTHGELVRGYGCDPRTAAEEFLLSKKEYEYKTGRNQGKHNVLLYHIRQSFKPGEIEPQKALEIGYEMVLRFTKGKYAFVIATHTDKEHIHNHITLNSTNLTCDGKFKDPKRSDLILRRISDLLCLENGLSVIDEPKLFKGKNYGKWHKEKYGSKPPSWQEKLRQKIDEILPDCKTFEDFISAMKSAGYKVNTEHKHITFLAEGQKKPTRLNTLKGDYTEEAIRERISKGLNVHNPSKDDEEKRTPTYEIPTDTSAIKISWLIDIQAKIKDGKGAGYENWSHIFNIKEMAKTLLYLKEQGIDSYNELVEKSAVISDKFSAVSTKIKTIEKRQKDIVELQRQIATYSKTREVYVAYKKSGFNNDFYENNRSNLALHEAAKKHFDSLGISKLPKISELKQEYATLQTQKKKLYAIYHESKKVNHDLLVAKHNAERILGINPEAKNSVAACETSLSKTPADKLEI